MKIARAAFILLLLAGCTRTVVITTPTPSPSPTAPFNPFSPAPASSFVIPATVTYEVNPPSSATLTYPTTITYQEGESLFRTTDEPPWETSVEISDGGTVYLRATTSIFNLIDCEAHSFHFPTIKGKERVVGNKYQCTVGPETVSFTS